MLSEADIQRIADTIVERFQPQKIVLFGSYANGTATEDSDVDLLVVKNSRLPRHRRAVSINKALFGEQKPVDVAVYTPTEVDEWRDVSQAFVSRALREGKVLYENPA